MIKMPQKKDIEIKNFYVFNSYYGPKEGEEEKKILYYYPAEDSNDTMIKNIGLTEAIIKFTRTFNPESCESLHTQKSRHLYFEPEKHFWMVMTLDVPYVTKTKDGTEYYEYHSEDVQDSVYRAVLKQAYEMFRLFAGTFVSLLGEETIEEKVKVLKSKLENFFTKYILNLKQYLKNVDILDVMQGMRYFSLDPLSFLKIQNFINLLEASFRMVTHTAFLYNEQLVWCGIEPVDIQLIYNYLVTTLLPAHTESELQGGSMPRNSSLLFSSSHFGRFIMGVPNVNDTENKATKVFLTDGTVFNFVVYRALSATVCLFIDATVTLNSDLFIGLNSFMGPQLTTIASDIAEKCAAKSPAGSSSDNSNNRYLYFNQLNLAVKSSIHPDNKKTKNTLVTPEVLKMIADLHKDATSSTYGETTVKSLSDCWVVSRHSNRRNFYVVIQQKNANLTEIHDEVKKVSEAQLKDIFFNPS